MAISRRFIITGTSAFAFLFTLAKKDSIIYFGRKSYWSHKLPTEDYNPPKLVILGSGWGAVSVVQRLIPGFYQTFIVSPQNYFLFTPLLAASVVGTVEPRSIIEPIRNIVYISSSEFLLAEAVDVNFEEGYVICKNIFNQEFMLDYDYLVIATGAKVNTFNIPGVKEHSFPLKDIENSRQIRRRLIDNFETALIPGQDEEVKKRLLTTVVVGGGPTGVECAAEIYDLIHHDLVKIYRKDVLPDARVILVQSADHILNTYDLRV